jgi:hypothetical protein
MSSPVKPKVKVLISSMVADENGPRLPGQVTLEQWRQCTSPKPLRLPPPPQPPKRKKNDSA